MRYSSRHLIHLAAIVETGSLTMAARMLGLTQPALSKSLHQLELQAGTALVHRDATGARATPLGAALAHYGKAMMNAAQRAEMHVEDWKRGVTGHLNIGAPPTVAANLLPPVIADFLAERPDVTMRVEVSPLSASLTKLEENQMDLYVGVIRPSHIPPEITAIPLYQDELCVFARAGHPIFSLPKVQAADLKAWRWTTPFRDTFFRGLIDSSCNRAGISSIKVAMETFSFDLQLSLLARADFLAMLPRKYMSRAANLRRVEAVEAELSGREFTIAALCRNRAEHFPLIMAFLEVLKELPVENTLEASMA